MRRVKEAALFLWLLLFCVPASSSAQIFSPGPLTRAHQSLDSLKSCDKCHSSAKGVDRERCLSCHTLIKSRIASKTGLHGRAEQRNTPCERCHTDHAGLDASIIAWQGGRRENFPHDETGYRLEGGHRKLTCEKCHEARRIQAPDVKKYATGKPQYKTWLGLPKGCSDCHFDEHRGQLKDDCQKCHTAEAWKPPPGFDHTKVWKLEGAHQKVNCVKCHKSIKDPAFSSSAFPAPRADSYLTMKPVPHALCTDCHKDPHRNRFGSDCRACHSMDKFSVTVLEDKVAFHKKTAFPLEGRHQIVPCERCHRVGKDGQKILRPIAHDSCLACHPNAHPDVKVSEFTDKACAECHSFKGYQPVRFGLQEHQKTRFPLNAAHQAVPCSSCHLKKMGPPLEVGPARPDPDGKLSSLVLSPWRMRAPGLQPASCDACHVSPHRDQFKGRQCTDCHSDSTFKVSPFQHAKTRYPLEGRHQQVDCRLCHEEKRDPSGAFVQYRPLETADCQPCHPDQHFGQFQRLTPVLACNTCHEVAGFKPTKFNHSQEAFSDFPLKGKHKALECGKCHTPISLGEGIETVRYRPTPMTCEQCHEDQHEGRFAAASELLEPVGEGVLLSGTAEALTLAGWEAPESWNVLPSPRTRCNVCHEEVDWRKVSFDHSTTDFPLRGMHKEVACEQCHEEGRLKDLPENCAGCHRDPHQMRLGDACEECHTESGFHDLERAIVQHGKTGFPLVGRHAVVTCTECHQDARALGFSRITTSCAACHRGVAPIGVPGVPDHSQVSDECQQCHSPLGWGAARYLAHGRCFPIEAGSNHNQFSCDDCHTSGVPATIGTCSSGVSCTMCHGCESERHASVSGYECQDQKCYRCHPGGDG